MWETSASLDLRGKRHEWL